MSLDGSRTIDSSDLPNSVFTILGNICFLFLFLAVWDPVGTFDKLLAMLVGLLLEETILTTPEFLLMFLLRTPLSLSGYIGVDKEGAKFSFEEMHY